MGVEEEVGEVLRAEEGGEDRHEEHDDRQNDAMLLLPTLSEEDFNPGSHVTLSSGAFGY